MKHMLLAVLSCLCVNLYATKPAELDMLDAVPGSNPKEVVLSTENIPEHASVLVRCNVNLPHYFESHFSFYVTPRVGKFGSIEDRTFYNDSKVLEVVNIGSKIYTTNNKFKNSPQLTTFYITDVTRAHEAVVMDFTNMPDSTTVECTF